MCRSSAGPHPALLRHITRPSRAHLLLHLFRNLAEEWRRALLAELAVHAALERVEAVELLARAGHADVAETALLFEVFVRVERLRVRQDPLFHPRQEDDAELEPLRRVQRHQRDAFFRFVAI